MAKERSVRVNGIELHFDESGHGAPLVLLHGMGGSSGDWRHAGRESLDRAYRTIAVDARGHGRSTNALAELTHRQCALDLLALLDALGVARCRAIGVSMGGNVLLHAASLAPERISAMVVVSAVASYGEEARRIMRAVSPDDRPEAEWAEMRGRHAHGDAQIRAIWRAMRALADDSTDMAFDRAALARISARTLLVQGDRDPLIPVERGIELFRGLPRAELWVVPGGGHGPIFLAQAAPFTAKALEFLAAG
ncbi:MAG TPA: alpha/beta hydrolase [Myxococcota bacterium]|nr:alpha/beta hydrolase [Myxococcota bacterium]